jgi:hypothetical protein
MNKKHKLATALAVVVLVVWASQVWATGGGDNYMYMDPGREATLTDNAQAPSSLVIATGAAGERTTLTLGRWNQATPPWTEPGAPYQDTFVFSNVSVTGPAGSTSQLILGPGNPNPGGVVGNGNIPPGNNNSVLLEVYTNGTTAGATPTHPQMEAIWSQIQAGFYLASGIPNLAPGNGITTTAPGASRTGSQRLAMLVKTDLRGAKYLGVIKDITGDVNGDFNVNINDVIQTSAYLDQPASALGWGKFTWQEGDINGDGIVNINDVISLAQNLDLGPYNPGGGSGFATVTASSDVAAATTCPEPATIVLLLTGGVTLFLVLDHRQRIGGPRFGSPRN